MIKIVGAGMAGLLAANMMRRREPVVYEMQGALPSNHSAVLRFRSPLVGEVLGVPFKPVRVLKSTLPWRNPVADSMAYSRKVIGEYRTDRSLLPGTSVEDRWIAPPDLVDRMAEGINIKYDTEFDFLAEPSKVISTIPMPNLMIIFNYSPRPAFGYVQGRNVRVQLRRCDAYLSLYVPDPELEFSRVSVTGNEMIIECSHDVERLSGQRLDAILGRAMKVCGINTEVEAVELRDQRYQKIAPIDETARRDFIHWISSQRGRAFSLGRYACWRPGLLMDDVVQDVRKIDGWLGSPSQNYDMELHRGRRT